jgi:hypothetical protein
MLDIIALHPFFDQNIALPEQPADIPRLAARLIIDLAHPFEAFRTSDKNTGKTLLHRQFFTIRESQVAEAARMDELSGNGRRLSEVGIDRNTLQPADIGCGVAPAIRPCLQRSGP